MIYQSPSNLNSHLTVKEREKPSLPTRILLERGLIKGTVLDFGSGLGLDSSFLRKNGFEVTSYDPHYTPAYPSEKYDTIICHYVLNVLLPKEQSHVLMAISELLKPDGTAYFAVRRDIVRSGFRYNPKRNCEVYQCNVKLNYESIFHSKYAEMYAYTPLMELVRKETVCKFCNASLRENIITESALFYAVYAPNSITKGHAIILPKFHKGDYFTLSEKERIAAWLVIERVKKIIEKHFQKTNFRIEMKAGKAVEHLAIHLIPTDSSD